MIEARGQLNAFKPQSELYLQQINNININHTWPRLIFLAWAGINNNAAVGSRGSKHGCNPAERISPNLRCMIPLSALRVREVVPPGCEGIGVRLLQLVHLPPSSARPRT